MLKKANDAASISSMILRAFFCDAMIRVHDEAGNVIDPVGVI